MTQTAPTGVVTLVFTDIQGSSAMWEQHRDAFRPVLEEHNRLIRESAARQAGFEVKTEGDSFFLAFRRASDGVRFAVETQQAFLAHDWAAFLPAIKELRVRIGMHTGEPILIQAPDGTPDYFGPMVNRAARVGAAGHGNQIVVSDSTRSLAQSELPAEITFQDHGVRRLKGVGNERLWQVQHPALPTEFPDLVTLDPEGHNLPTFPTSFLGREAEIDRLHALTHDPRIRLLTLVGSGGVGKTRLALHLAELCVGEYEHGVWWVELDQARTPDQMRERIVSSLRVHLQPQPTGEEQLAAFLRDRKLLLVLDNVEQIPGSEGVVSDLLGAAPGLKCLVTSRRSLDLRAEHLVEVSPLLADESINLFIERARSRREGFAMNPANAADIRELCRRLEGVPLAIELAASRVVGMAPREILHRLTERFRLLTTRAPDLPPRLSALRGAIDWSYDLLSDDDKSLFAQAAVFAGGFILESAEAVCSAVDVFEGVMELRRQSLLRMETDPDTQENRYLMLESLREYAAEKLEAAWDRGQEVRQRHLDHFVRFAEDRATALHTREEGRALDELARERDNLGAAMDWADEIGKGEECARLAIAVYDPLHLRGFWAAAYRRLRQGWQAAEKLGPQAGVLKAALTCHLADLAHDMGDRAEALRWAQVSLSYCREESNPEALANVQNMLGILAMDERNMEVAQEHFAESLRLRTEHRCSGRGKVLNNLALLAKNRGDTAAARRLYEEALACRREGGDVRGEALTLGNIGILAEHAGDDAEALRLYRAALRIYRELQDRKGIATMLNNVGELAERTGSLESAAAYFVHAERIFRELQSSFTYIPEGWLQKLSRQLGPERLGELRVRAETAGWESLVEEEPIGPRAGDR